MEKTGLAKISFDTDPDGFGAGSPERLWAKEVPGKFPRRFELHNSPFYAKGVSYMDVIEAEEVSGEKLHFRYTRTVLQSGHSTYRILIDKNSTEFFERWQVLEAFGCTYELSEESSTKRLYAIDVPPDANIFLVYEILEKGESDEIWLFDEGHCAHAVGRTN